MEVKAFFSAKNSFSSTGVHCYLTPGLVRRLRGSARVAKSSMKRLLYWTEDRRTLDL